MSFSKTWAIAAILGLSTVSAQAETATLAGGCFWCVEADMESIDGVGDAISGFSGGTTPLPEYQRSGDHIEAVQFSFDENVISYRDILDLFLRSIDPLDASGQFCDRGREYTSAIFVDGPSQAGDARAAIKAAEADLGRSIVTPILPTTEFYPVDSYHQDYYKSDDRLAFSSVGFGVKKKDAYKRYRVGCGRDARIRTIWGDAAPFVNGE
jgi:peptide-methionine (S)-S-oxide reductase